MPASHRISYWQADARFKHPLLIAKERELEELRAALLMQRAAFGWLVRLRVKQTKVAQGASQGRKLSITSENWQTEKSLKKKKQTGVRMAVDDAVVVDAGSAAVTLAIKRQAIQTARRNFEQQVATTTVVCEPMDCVLASILRKVRPNKEAQNDRFVARALRAAHHAPFMWSMCLVGGIMYFFGEPGAYVPVGGAAQRGVQRVALQLDGVQLYARRLRLVAEQLHSLLGRVTVGGQHLLFGSTHPLVPDRECAADQSHRPARRDALPHGQRGEVGHRCQLHARSLLPRLHGAHDPPGRGCVLGLELD